MICLHTSVFSLNKTISVFLASLYLPAFSTTTIDLATSVFQNYNISMHHQNTESMKIIVTGSLGHISKPLADSLLQKGHSVVIVGNTPYKQRII